LNGVYQAWRLPIKGAVMAQGPVKLSQGSD